MEELADRPGGFRPEGADRYRSLVPLAEVIAAAAVRSQSDDDPLLHALAGLVPAEDLRLAVGGETIVDTAAGLAPRAHERRVGLVFDGGPERGQVGLIGDGDGPPEQRHLCRALLCPELIYISMEVLDHQAWMTRRLTATLLK